MKYPLTSEYWLFIYLFIFYENIRIFVPSNSYNRRHARPKRKRGPSKVNSNLEIFKMIKMPLPWAYYHMLEHLLQLRIRMISTGFDIVISESISKAFIKLLQDLSQTNSINLNKKKKL